MKHFISSSLLLGVLAFSRYGHAYGDVPTRLDVPADSQTKTTITARKGDRFKIVASGVWKMGSFIGTCGPDGFDPGEYATYCIIQAANHGALVVRSGFGDWQRVGASSTIVADAAGPLVFSPNDTERGNNGGMLTITLRRLVDEAPDAVASGNFEATARANTRAYRSDIHVRKGQLVRLQATGTWKMGTFIGACDADGMTFAGDSEYNRFRNAKHGCLMVMVDGDDGWYTCGSECVFRADVSGKLIFAPNDNEVANNSGSLVIKATITD